MKKTIIILGLVALLLMSNFAVAGFWDKLTGNAFFSFGKKKVETPSASSSLTTTLTTPISGDSKCKTFGASNVEHITGNQVCANNSFGQCITVLGETTTSYSYDRFNVGLQTQWSRFFDCDLDLIIQSGEWHELREPWNMFDRPVYIRDHQSSPPGSVLCCK